VTVPLLAVNVPLFVIFPAMVKLAEAGATNVPLLLIVNEPFTSMFGLLVLAVAVTVLDPSPILRLLLTVIVCDPADPSVEAAQAETTLPTVIIAHTIPGKGVSFMERNYLWHGKVPSESESAQAIAELSQL
jgi:hypothetical protein